MKKRTLAPMLLAVVILGALQWMNTGCGSNAGGGKGGPVKFGVVLPETGPLAQLGVPKREAILLAADQINASGGVGGKRLEVVVGDNQGDPNAGINVMRKLHTVDGASFFYVDVTRIAYACAPIAEQEKVVMFAGSTHPAITEGKQWVFRVFTSGDQETSLLSEYLVRSSVQSIYILHTNEILGESSRAYLTRKFEAAGGKVLGSDAFELGQKDCRDILVKARNSKADRIVLLDYGVTVPTLLTQASELGIPSKRLVGNIGFVGPRVAAVGAKLTEGIVFTGPSYAFKFHAPDTPQMKAFIDGYQQKYSKLPDYTAAYAFDTIMLLKDTIAQVGTDPLAVRDALRRVSDYPGVSGRITFHPNGDTTTEVSVMTYKDGQAVPVD